jgi:hypothetical protein
MGFGTVQSKAFAPERHYMANKALCLVCSKMQTPFKTAPHYGSILSTQRPASLSTISPAGRGYGCLLINESV